MAKLIFEKVGDIHSTYAYLCVYDENDTANPFMEISVTDDKQLLFTIYAFPRNVALTLAKWQEIRDKANIFLPEVLADEAQERGQV